MRSRGPEKVRLPAFGRAEPTQARRQGSNEAGPTPGGPRPPGPSSPQCCPAPCSLGRSAIRRAHLRAKRPSHTGDMPDKTPAAVGTARSFQGLHVSRLPAILLAIQRRPGLGAPGTSQLPPTSRANSSSWRAVVTRVRASARLGRAPTDERHQWARAPTGTPIASGKDLAGLTSDSAY